MTPARSNQNSSVTNGYRISTSRQQRSFEWIAKRSRTDEHGVSKSVVVDHIKEKREKKIEKRFDFIA